MSVSLPVTQPHAVQLATATTSLPDDPAGLDEEQFERWGWKDSEPECSSLMVSCGDHQPQPSINEEPAPPSLSTTGHSYKADYIVIATVFVIIVFLWMQ